jgi:outer membrane protein
MKKIAWLLACPLFASPVFSADLMQVYRDALVNDPVFAAARASLDAGREKAPQGLSSLLPTLAVSGNTAWNDADSDPRNNPAAKSRSEYNTHAYQLTLSQPLFRWQNWVAYDQARLQVAQAEASFVQARQDLILRVAQAYFDVLNAGENLSAVQANKQAIAQQLELAKKSFEVGTATITDTHEAQARFDLGHGSGNCRRK